MKDDHSIKIVDSKYYREWKTAIRPEEQVKNISM